MQNDLFYAQCFREDGSHPNLVVCLPCVDVKKIFKIWGWKHSLCWSYPCPPVHTGWRVLEAKGWSPAIQLLYLRSPHKTSVRKLKLYRMKTGSEAMGLYRLHLCADVVLLSEIWHWSQQPPSIVVVCVSLLGTASTVCVPIYCLISYSYIHTRIHSHSLTRAQMRTLFVCGFRFSSGLALGLHKQLCFVL